MTRNARLLFRLSLGLLCGGCERSSLPGSQATTQPAARVAVSNSFLEAAVLDVLGGNEPVLRLAEPGMCPGHFDIRPSQINELRRCKTLLRFDFQQSLDEKLSNLVKGGMTIREIRVPGGLCEPSSYLMACRQIAETLAAGSLMEKTTADERLAAIEKRITAKSDWCRAQLAQAGWSGRAVVCSSHQKAFCSWLGLQVTATFSGSDTASIGEIETAIRAGNASMISVVIANLPEGRRLADALGQRMNARVVVFGNFPMMQSGDEPPFDALLSSNVSALVNERQH